MCICLSILGDVAGKGKSKDFITQERGQGGFPKDWKLNRNTQAVATGKGDTGCESGLASLQGEHLAYSVWTKGIENDAVNIPRWRQRYPRCVRYRINSVPSSYGRDVEISFKSAKLMETDPLKMHS